jgi:hypothetical protein
VCLTRILRVWPGQCQWHAAINTNLLLLLCVYLVPGQGVYRSTIRHSVNTGEKELEPASKLLWADSESKVHAQTKKSPLEEGACTAAELAEQHNRQLARLLSPFFSTSRSSLTGKEDQARIARVTSQSHNMQLQSPPLLQAPAACPSSGPITR